MAFGTLTVTPASLTLTFASSLTSSFCNAIYQAIAPTDPSTGAIWNATGGSSVVIKLDNGQQPNAKNWVEVSLANTLVSATSAGIVFSCTQAQVSTALASLFAAGALSGRLTLLALDGTNELPIATGQWSCNIVP